MPAFTLEKSPDGIAVLTFDLPGEKVNKLAMPVMEELDRLLDGLASDRGVRALVIASGKPDTFIAGADIAEIRDIDDPARGEELSRRGQAVLQKLEDLPYPTVAAVHGACLGGGMELALACRFRVVSNDPRTMLGLPEVRLGIIPGFGGTQRLPRLTGLANALDMILTGRSVPARKAKRLGLADDMVHREDLLVAAARIAGTAAREGVRARRPPLVRLLESTPLTRWLIYRKAEQNILKETKGNYPAPLAALDAVKHGLSRGLAAGYAREAATIGRLIASPIAKNLIHVFFLGEALKHSARASDSTIGRAAVIGAGVMGGGIAQLFAEKGLTVRLRDVSARSVGAGLRTAADIFRKRERKGLLDPLQARDGMDRISGGTGAEGLARADIAVEAVVENMDIKKQVLREFEAVAKPDAVFASNTSSLSITELASAAAGPGRVAGMHFFNPVEKMPLVEIVRGKRTDPATVAAVASLSVRLGKLPVVVNDGPGFLVNRILMPYLAEAARMLEEGDTIEHIDGVLTRFGMPMGAFILLDEIGLDVAHKVGDILHRGLGDRLAPPALLARMHAEGALGKKNGKGFYRYDGRERTGPDPAVRQLLSVPAGAAPLPDEDVRDRAILLMLKEAALCLEEGIIDRPDLLDAALVFGIGFPPFRGGLLRYADHYGARAAVERLERFADRHGERFAPPQALRELSRDDLIRHIVT